MVWELKSFISITVKALFIYTLNNDIWNITATATTAG